MEFLLEKMPSKMLEKIHGDLLVLSECNYFSYKIPVGWSTKLVAGWTNPVEKYARQIGSFPQG